jgi:hypothetical protein
MHLVERGARLAWSGSSRLSAERFARPATREPAQEPALLLVILLVMHHDLKPFTASPEVHATTISVVPGPDVLRHLLPCRHSLYRRAANRVLPVELGEDAHQRCRVAESFDDSKNPILVDVRPWQEQWQHGLQEAHHAALVPPSITPLALITNFVARFLKVRGQARNLLLFCLQAPDQCLLRPPVLRGLIFARSRPMQRPIPLGLESSDLLRLFRASSAPLRGCAM